MWVFKFILAKNGGVLIFLGKGRVLNLLFIKMGELWSLNFKNVESDDNENHNYYTGFSAQLFSCWCKQKREKHGPVASMNRPLLGFRNLIYIVIGWTSPVYFDDNWFNRQWSTQQWLDWALFYMHNLKKKAGVCFFYK